MAAGTTYSYRIVASGTAGDSAPSDVATATTASLATLPTYVSDLTWASAASGYGTVQKDKSIAGNTLALNGVTYPKGIGTHASSTIVYTLGGQYNTFQSDVGIDAEEDGKGEGFVDFQVLGDGKVLYDSGVLSNGQVGHVNVSVAGVKTLTLQAINGVAGSIDFDHADWAGAAVFGMPSAPAAPSNLAAAAPDTSSIQLTWTTNSANQTGFTIQRSTDGTTFTTVATNVPASATTWTDSAGLSPATAYSYRVYATNATGTSAASNVATAKTQPIQTVTYLSDLAWASATSGWGAVQNDKSIAGNALTLNGVTYAKGLGTHAASTIVYNLGGRYTTFLSDVGVDDEENGKGVGSVDFQVWGDCKLLFDSGTLHNGDPTASVNVDVTGVQTLTLVATNAIPDDIDFDHADWAGARLLG